jgi:4,5-DOPA dioxygenase extradiol
MGSGNVAHNLQLAQFGHDAQPFDWAVRFDVEVRSRIEAGDDASLVNYSDLGGDARLAIPTPDHYYPLLHVLGARHPDDVARFPVEGIDGAALSMLSVVLG